MINMNEPVDPQERKDAIWLCRVNAFLDADTGLPEPDIERSRDLWATSAPSVPYAKWLWMWNYAIGEWRTQPPVSNEIPK